MKLYYFDENDEEYKECVPSDSCLCTKCAQYYFNKCAQYYFNNGQCFGDCLKNDPQDSNVEHPNHYKGTDTLECIDVIQFSFGIDGFIYYCAGNVLKYLWRYNNKNGTEDIKKAKQYLDIMDDLSTHMSAQAYDIYSRSLWLYKRSVDDKKHQEKSDEH